MKKALIPALLLAALLVVGCDFIRVVAGRPTAAQVEELHQEQLRQEEARRQARLDSIERVRQHKADSLAALEAHLLDSLSQTRTALMGPARMGGLLAEKPAGHYSLVVGAFRERANAQRKVKACNQAGYDAIVLRFRSGLDAVAVSPSDSISVVVDCMHALQREGLCPNNAWILVNE